MLPHTQLRGDDQRLSQPLHQAFLGDDSVGPGSIRMLNQSTMNISAHDSSRVIGTLSNNYNGPTYQFYNSGQPSEQSRILEWLWPQYSDLARRQATPNHAKQKAINELALKARRGEKRDPWLLQEETFAHWLSSKGGNLWIRGKVGCGKTVLFTAVVKHIQSFSNTQNKICLAYYYCRLPNDGNGELGMILRKWLAQISNTYGIPKCLQELYELCHDSYPPIDPTLEKLEDTLLEILRNVGTQNLSQEVPGHSIAGQKVFLLADALDEVSIDDGQNLDVLRMLQRIACENLPNVFILATSRDRPDIGEYLRPSFDEVRMDYEAINEEIVRYIPGALKIAPRLNRPEIKEAITDTLVKKANGMFLWVALQIRLLVSLKVVNMNTVTNALSELPTDLNETYRRIFDGIEQDQASRALLALKWIVLARRPLYIEELVEACAFRPGPCPNMEPESTRLDSYNFFELLQDLVVIEPHLDLEAIDTGFHKHTHTVTIAHVSLNEYLTGTKTRSNDGHPFRFSPDDGHRLLASSCFSYLFHFNTNKIRNATSPLLEYAFYHWEKHVMIDGGVPKEKGRVRRKALLLYEQLKETVNGIPDGPQQEMLHQLLSWLPQGRLESMLEALNMPYFHPHINQFLAEQDSEVAYPRYRPLSRDRKAIRLLYLLPSLDKEGPVWCRLEEVSLDDRPAFDALSYVWGGPGPTLCIRVDGNVSRVTSNLYHILKTLCAQEQGNTPAVWVDALCINQQDIEERSHQVVLLGPIFQAAQEVVLCMGVEHETDEEAIATIEDLASTGNVHNAIHSTPLPPQDQTCLAQLFDKAFWSRTWTIQEVVLANRGTILLGTLSFPLNVVEDLFRPIHCTSCDAFRCYHPLRYRFLLNRRFDFVRNHIFTRIEYKTGRRFELPELLCRFSRNIRLDLRDMIYSLLGLLGGVIPREFMPDYGKPWQQVFSEVASANLTINGNLNIFSHISTDSEAENLPSWVPLYRNTTLPLLSCAKDRWIFRAGGSARPRITSLHPRVICASGVTLYYAKTTFETRGCDSDPIRLRTMLETATGSSCMPLFWDVFLAGQSDYGCRLFDGSVPGIKVPPETKEDELALLQSSEYLSWPDFRLGRRFFQTSSGALGLGPKALQEGDVVVVLVGGPVPYLLRKAPCEDFADMWRIVGECYLSGFMDGEAVHGDVNLEQFIIT